MSTIDAEPDIYRASSNAAAGYLLGGMCLAWSLFIVVLDIQTVVDPSVPGQQPLPWPGFLLVAILPVFLGVYMIRVGRRARIELSDEFISLVQYRTRRVPLAAATGFQWRPNSQGSPVYLGYAIGEISKRAKVCWARSSRDMDALNLLLAERRAT